MTVLILFILNNSSALYADNFTPLPADQAYPLTVMLQDHQTILVRWNISPGYFLYQTHIHFSAPNPNTSIASALMPPGIPKYNSELGNYRVYAGELNIIVPITQSDHGRIAITVHYQGCAEQGFCYPPMDATANLNVNGPYLKPATLTGDANQIVSGSPRGVAARDDHNTVPSLFQTHHLITVFLAFLGFGILLAFTPCVLPVLPILSSIVLGQKNITLQRSAALSISYVLGLCISYAIIGCVFGFIGANLQTALQNPFAIGVLVAILVGMSLSLFGFYTVQLPARWQQRFSQTGTDKRGTFMGALVMGAFSGLVLSPCVTPPLVGALTFISATGNVWVGSLSLFFFGLGMGVPLLILGILGGKFLPKAGAWMERVKAFLGWILLGLAVDVLARILSPITGQWLWTACFVGFSIWLGAFRSVIPRHCEEKRSFNAAIQTIPDESPRGKATRDGNSRTWPITQKILGILIFVYSILLAIGALQHNSSLTHPIRFTTAPSASNHTLPFFSAAEIQAAIHNAQQQHKPVLLDFYADWCTDCKIMAHTVFENSAVKKELKKFVVVRVDVTQNDATAKQVEKMYGVVAPPTFVFLKDGQEMPHTRIVGLTTANNFLTTLQAAETT